MGWLSGHLQVLFQNNGAVLVADAFWDEASHVQEFGLPFASCQLSGAG